MCYQVTPPPVPIDTLNDPAAVICIQSMRRIPSINTWFKLNGQGRAVGRRAAHFVLAEAYAKFCESRGWRREEIFR